MEATLRRSTTLFRSDGVESAARRTEATKPMAVILALAIGH
jgi:hypothetical protein